MLKKLIARFVFGIAPAAAALFFCASNSAAAEGAYEAKFIAPAAGTAEIESAAARAANETVAEDTGEISAGLKKRGRTEEIWLRLKSRFKTSEIELARRKFARENPEDEYFEGTAEIGGGGSYGAGLADGDTAEAYFEGEGTGEVSAASGEVALRKKKARRNAAVKKGETSEAALRAKPSPAAGSDATPEATEEVRVESGENLFLRHCYACHFDHSHFKMANNLSGREFWTRYGRDGAGIKKVIRSGVRTSGGDMPAYNAERLGDREADAIIEHLKSMTQPVKIDPDAAVKKSGAGKAADAGKPAATAEVSLLDKASADTAETQSGAGNKTAGAAETCEASIGGAGK